MADLLRLQAAGRCRERRPWRWWQRRSRGHLRLAARRAAAHGNVRHEAGRPGGVPRRVPADPHERRRASTSASTCRCTPKLADKFTLIRSIAHDFADHGGGHKRFLTGRDPIEPVGFVNDYPMVGSMVAKCASGATSACRTTSPAPTAAGSRSTCSASAPPTSARRTHPFTVAGDPSEPNFQVQNLGLADGDRRPAGRPRRAAGRARQAPPRASTSSGAMDAMDKFNQRAIDLLDERRRPATRSTCRRKTRSSARRTASRLGPAGAPGPPAGRGRRAAS